MSSIVCYGFCVHKLMNVSYLWVINEIHPTFYLLTVVLFHIYIIYKLVSFEAGVTVCGRFYELCRG